MGAGLYMRDATFETDVYLDAVKVDGNLDLSGSSFRGKELSINGGVVRQNLYMSDKAIFETDTIDLSAVKVGSDLVLIGSSFRGKELSINGGVVGDDLFMRDKATFEIDTIDLIGVKVGGDLDLDGSSFRGEKLSINGGVLGSALFMRNATFEIDTIDLIRVKVKSDLDLDGSSFRGKEFNINGGLVGSYLFMRNDATFETDNIYLTNIKANYFELGNVTIQGYLYLTGAEVNIFEIYDFLPIVNFNSVNITNFTYNLLNNNSVEFLKNTLDKLEYIPQPYEQFARVARQMGLLDEAEDMLVQSKNKELMQELKKWNLPRVLGLVIQGGVVGYGYKIEYSFYWSLLFLALGWYLKARESKRAQELGINSLFNNINPGILLSLFINMNCLNRIALILFLQKFEMGIGRSFLYTLDTLLPLIVLDERHKDLVISRSTQIYFYFLNLWGYLLVVLLLPLLFI